MLAALALALAAAPAPACVVPAPDEDVLQHGAVTLGAGEDRVEMVAAAAAVAVRSGTRGETFGVAETELRVWDRDCGPVHRQMYGNAAMLRFETGRLGGGRGDGIAMWHADWGSGESHYAPHFADMVLYRWDGNGFAGPERLRTAARVAAEPDAAPVALGLPFRDSTRPEVFEPELAKD